VADRRATDHGVSEAVYPGPGRQRDRAYRDKPEEEWPRPENGGGVAMHNAPLDLQALLSEAG
jgi:catechol-2,3-dioxygenase